MGKRTSYSAEIELTVKGLDSLKQMNEQVNQKKMSNNMRGQFEDASKEYEKMLSQIGSRMKKGDLDFSDLKIDEFIEQLDKLERKRAAGLKSSYTKKDKGLQNQVQQIKLLQQEYKALKDEANKAGDELERLKSQKDKTAQSKGLESSDMDHINQKISEEKQVADEGTKAQSKKAQEKLRQLQETKKEIVRQNELIKEQAVRYDSILTKQRDKNKQVEEETRLKEQMHQKHIKGLEDPGIKMTQEAKGILSKTNALSRQKQEEEALKKAKDANKTATDDNEKADKKHEQTMTQKIATGVKYYVVLNQLRRLYRSLIRTVSEFDRAMTSVAMVSSMNREQAWNLASAYNELGDQVGMAATEVANLSIYFFRQGRSASDALEMTRVAAESARVAAIDATESANYLTSAINGFQLAASDAEQVADRFAALGAASASSYDELARAMSKVAPSARSAGVDIDHMMGFLAKGIETTREAPQNIGTAFKTVFARMQELTDFGKTLEDGVSVNRIEEALKQVNVSLRDSMGIFRPAQDVINDLGQEWDGLNRNMQAYIAVAFAGIRQQPRFLALMNNYGRTMELVEESQGSAGEMAVQHSEYIQGLEGSVQRLQNSWVNFINSISDSDGIIVIVDTLRKTVNGVTKAIQLFGDGGVVMVTVMGSMVAALAISRIGFLKETAAILSGLGPKAADLATRYRMIIATRAATTAKQKENLQDLIKRKGLIKAILLMNSHNKTKAASNALSGKAIFLNKVWGAANIFVGGTLLFVAKAVKAVMLAALPIAGILLLITGAFWLLSKAVEGLIAIGKKIGSWFSSLGDGAEEAAEEVKKLSNELHNLNKEERQLGDLIDRFDELDSKVEKTKDEIKEMGDILNDLQEYDVMGEDYDFTERSASGRLIFNRSEYEKAMEKITEEQEKIRNKQLKKLAGSLQDDLSGTLEQDEFQALIRSITYEAQEVKIEGLDEELRNQIDRSFDNMVTGFEFTEDMMPDTTTKRLFGVDLFREKKEVEEFFGEYEQILTEMMDDMDISTSGDVKHTFMEAVKDESITQMDLMQVIAGEYSDAMFSIAETAANVFEKEYDSEDAGSEIRAMLKVVEEVNNEIDKAAGDSEEMAERLRTAFEMNFTNEFGLVSLLEKYDFDEEIIIKWVTEGASINEIDDFMDKLEDVSNTTSKAYIGSSLQDVDISDQLFELMVNVDFSTEEGIADFYENQMKDFERFDTDWGKLFPDLMATFGPDTDALARSIDQMAESQSDLYEKQAEYLENGKLSATDLLDITKDYGEAGWEAVKNGEDLSFLFDQQIEQDKEKIRNQISIIQGALDAGAIAEENVEWRKSEVAYLEEILDNMDDMSAFDQKRIADLKQIERYTKRMSDSYSRLSSLADLGLEDSGIYRVLEAMSRSYSDVANAAAFGALEADITKLLEKERELIRSGAEMQNGQWMRGQSEEINDLIDEWENLYEKSQDTTDAYINNIEQQLSAMEESYSNQKDIIEDRYSAEMDHIQQIHDLRWKEMDYQNSLEESNQSILDVRRRISSLSRDDSRAASYQRKEAEKQLQQQQRERQKMIEEEMLDRETKRMEEARDKELKEIEKEQTNAIIELTEKIKDLTESLIVGSTDEEYSDDPDNVQNVKITNLPKGGGKSNSGQDSQLKAFENVGW